MRVAVCRPGAGAARTRLEGVLEGLRGAHEVELFGPEHRSPRELRPREYERLLVPVADDPACAPFLPVLRRLGGTVWLLDWELPALAGAHRPSLGRGGVAGRLAAWREGGLPAARGRPSPLNRSVVRFADAFVVPRAAWRARILEERNAPTPVGVMESDDGAALAQWLGRLPSHWTNRKSLIATAIEAADQAREARRGEGE